MKKSFEWPKYLRECMKSTEYCCISTVDEMGTWSNPVYFAWNDQWGIYFISQPTSRHMQNIQQDSRISIAIYSTDQDTFGDVVGIQIQGRAEVLSAAKDIREAQVAIDQRRYGSREKEIPQRTAEDFMKGSDWQYAMIVPGNIFYFDTRFFGEERQEVPRKLYAS